VVGDVAPEALDELVLVPGIRGAPLAVAERDLGVFTAGLEPPDEEAAKAVVGNAWRSLDGIGAMEALDRISEAVYESLRSRAKCSPAACACLRTSFRSTPAVTATCSCPTPPCASESGRRSAARGACSSPAKSRGCGVPPRRQEAPDHRGATRQVTSAATDELAGEIERLAPFRGADSGDLRLAAP